MSTTETEERPRPLFPRRLRRALKRAHTPSKSWGLRHRRHAETERNRRNNKQRRRH